MAQPRGSVAYNETIDRETFKKDFAELGAAGVAKKYGIAVRNVMHRRRKIEEIEGVSIMPPCKRWSCPATRPTPSGAQGRHP